MNLATILSIVNAVLANAPTIAAGVQNAKQLIDALFTTKIITADQQNALHGYVDANEALHKAGIVPEHWKVQPDPA